MDTANLLVIYGYTFLLLHVGGGAGYALVLMGYILHTLHK
jgi:hypothetical protein